MIDGPARPSQGSGQQADESKGGPPVGAGRGGSVDVLALPRSQHRMLDF